MYVVFMLVLVRITVLITPDGGHVGDENTFACLKAAFDAGINFFDAAEGWSWARPSSTLAGIGTTLSFRQRSDIPSHTTPARYRPLTAL